MAKNHSSKGHARSAISGRYVTAATAARHPRTTVVEATGGGGGHGGSRSAITGRYVTAATAARHPHTTVTNR